MTDLRRSVLWVVFSMSLLLLWDAWQVHQGRSSLFSPAPQRPAASAPLQSASGVPSASATAPAGVPAAATAPGGAVPTAPAVATAEQFTVQTDRIKAVFSSLGGSLVQVELLTHQDDARKEPMRVLDPLRGYAAQSGVVGVAGAPTHLTTMRLVSSERELKDGAQQLNLRFGFVKAVKLLDDGEIQCVATDQLHIVAICQRK